MYTHLDFQHLAKVYDAAHPRARRRPPQRLKGPLQPHPSLESLMKHDPERIYGTTILAVRRDGRVAVGGDGQVTLGTKRHEGQCAQGAPPVRRQGARRDSPAARPMPSPCSSASRASWRNSAISRGPPSSWRRTGAATEACAGWRPCCASRTPRAPTSSRATAMSSSPSMT